MSDMAPETPGIDRLTRLLQLEIDAIQSGELTAAAALLSDKEAAATEAEAELAGLGEDPDPELVEKARRLKALVDRSAAMLSRVKETTREIVSELEKIRRRHSLEGGYGRAGERRDVRVTQAERLNKTL